MKIERTPEPFTDENGQQCVRVPLAKGIGEAVTYLETFEGLIAQGVSPLWQLNHNRSAKDGHAYVKAKGRCGTPQTIARLIASASTGRHVHYSDGNRLNLRPENLVVTVGGRAIVDAAEILERQSMGAHGAE